MAHIGYRNIPVGSSRQSIYVEMKDSVTPFQPKAGLAFNTAGISLSYVKKRGARVAITPVDLASPTAAWLSGGVKEVDAVNMVGVVRFDLPDVLFVPGPEDEATITIQATGYETMTVKIPLVKQTLSTVGMGANTVRTNN